MRLKLKGMFNKNCKMLLLGLVIIIVCSLLSVPRFGGSTHAERAMVHNMTSNFMAAASMYEEEQGVKLTGFDQFVEEVGVAKGNKTISLVNFGTNAPTGRRCEMLDRDVITCIGVFHDYNPVVYHWNGGNIKVAGKALDGAPEL